MEKYVFKSRKWWKSEWNLYHQEGLVGSIILKSGWSGYVTEVEIGGRHWQIKCNGWKNNFLIIDSAGTTIAKTTSHGFWKQTSDVDLLGKRYVITFNWKGRQSLTELGGAEVIAIEPSYWKSDTVVSIHNPKNEAELLLASLLFSSMKINEITAAVSAVTAIAVISAAN